MNILKKTYLLLFTLFFYNIIGICQNIENNKNVFKDYPYYWTKVKNQLLKKMKKDAITEIEAVSKVKNLSLVIVCVFSEPFNFRDTAKPILTNRLTCWLEAIKPFSLKD